MLADCAGSYANVPNSPPAPLVPLANVNPPSVAGVFTSVVSTFPLNGGVESGGLLLPPAVVDGLRNDDKTDKGLKSI